MSTECLSHPVIDSSVFSQRPLFDVHIKRVCPRLFFWCLARWLSRPLADAFSTRWFFPCQITISGLCLQAAMLRPGISYNHMGTPQMRTLECTTVARSARLPCEGPPTLGISCCNAVPTFSALADVRLIWSCRSIHPGTRCYPGTTPCIHLGQVFDVRTFFSFLREHSRSSSGPVCVHVLSSSGWLFLESGCIFILVPL